MRMFPKSPNAKMVAGVAAAALLGLPLAACGADEPAAAATPDPVAQVDNLSGKSTAVQLDAGFVDALTSLKLTPGVIGDAALTDGALVFPITGGNVTYYEPGSIDPYVQGEI